MKTVNRFVVEKQYEIERLGNMERVKIGELWVKEVIRKGDDLEIILTSNRDKSTEIKRDDLIMLYRKYENLTVVYFEIKEIDITEMKWMSF